ncbi:hypothetical protein ADK43_14055 [Streptomyces rimosus subsp. rimosus]|nr:hypothetical protein ADK43_14055 [Streptomyces rimosus subsp. rimosus]
MSGQPSPELPPEDGPSITAHVTATGAVAEYLRQLAAVVRLRASTAGLVPSESTCHRLRLRRAAAG